MVLCRLVRPCVISEAHMLLSLSTPSTCILTRRRFCLEETTTDCIATSQEQLYAHMLLILFGSLLVPVITYCGIDDFTAATLYRLLCR